MRLSNNIDKLNFQYFCSGGEHLSRFTACYFPSCYCGDHFDNLAVGRVWLLSAAVFHAATADFLLSGSWLLKYHLGAWFTSLGAACELVG